MGRPNWDSTRLTSIGKGPLNGPSKVWLMPWHACVVMCPHVLMSSRASVSCVLVCSLSSMPCMLTCSCANVPCMLMWSHASVLCVLMCSHANMSSMLMCSYANVPCLLTGLSINILYVGDKLLVQRFFQR